MGALAPWFRSATRARGDYAFDTVAGRHVLLCFPGRWDGVAARLIESLLGGPDPFDDARLSFFGVQVGVPTGGRAPAPGEPLLREDRVPDIFEPALCHRLIACSGFMREVDGLTVGLVDHSHKRRRDCLIEDEGLRRATMQRIHERLVPQIERAFQFRATRMERYIVSCYDASERGMFRAHRDNTTRGTAHRRFALSLFLNDGYEGGQLVFPEYGSALYSAPAGGGVVFSCSILHEALPVTAGRRCMFLPFLYDEAARRVRSANAAFLGRNEAFGGGQ